jgi:hypothetical protein
MTFTEKTEEHREKPVPVPLGPGLLVHHKSHLDLHGERPAKTHLSCGTQTYLLFIITHNFYHFPILYTKCSPCPIASVKAVK